MKNKNLLLGTFLTVSIAFASCGTDAGNKTETAAVSADTAAATTKPPITLEMVNAAQQAWCDALVSIAKAHKEGGDYKTIAGDVLTNLYDYDKGQVLFKPTLAFGPNTFRLDKEGAAAYFIGGNPKYPEDNGFALKPWVKATFDNAGVDDKGGVLIHGDIAITMGNVFLTDADGKETVVDKTFVFKQGDDGKLRLIVHKSALPFDPKK
jgi:hypothetical protein